MEDIFKLYTNDKIIKTYEASYYLLNYSNKQKILQGINKNEFLLDCKTIEKLDKFFEKKWKPSFMKFEKMLKEVADFKKSSIKLRDFLYESYNYNSQITHGEFFNWLETSQDKSERINMLHSTFKRIIYTIITILQDNDFQLNLQEIKYQVDVLENMSDDIQGYFSKIDS